MNKNLDNLEVGDYVEIYCSGAEPDRGRIYSMNDSGLILYTIGENGEPRKIHINYEFVTKPVRVLSETFSDRVDRIKSVVNKHLSAEMVELSTNEMMYTGTLLRLYSDAVLFRDEKCGTICIPYAAINKIADVLN